ncbi:MAG: WGR domain-containing protein [Myxococcales bacterium]|nr:WGR domain-containing protein [Myxococcales bacterium]
MRRFELDDGTDRLFWKVEVQGNQVVSTVGKIGTRGQRHASDHASEKAAKARVATLIKKMTAKGYVEVDAKPAKTAKTAAAKPAAAKATKPAKTAAAKPAKPAKPAKTKPAEAAAAETTASAGASLLAELLAGLDRLAAHKDILMESLVVRPPSGASADGLPAEWQAFYGACDGVQVRWRHRHSKRDQDALGGKPFSSLRKRGRPRPIHELGYEVAGRIEIAPLASVIGKNRAWDEVVAGVREYCDQGATLTIDGVEVPLVDAYARLRPFDRFDGDAAIFVRRDTYRLLYTYQNKELEYGAARELTLTEYIRLLAAHGGAALQRRANFLEGQRPASIDLDDPKSLLLGDFQLDPATLAASFDPVTYWQSMAGIEAYSDAYYEEKDRLEQLVKALGADRTVALCEHALVELAGRPVEEPHGLAEALLEVIRFFKYNTPTITPAQDEAIREHLVALAAAAPADDERYESIYLILKERGDTPRVEALIRGRLAHAPIPKLVKQHAREAKIPLPGKDKAAR